MTEITLTLTTNKADGTKAVRDLSVKLYEGQHASEAAYNFCTENNIFSHDEVAKITGQCT